jgi:voltage-gated potassium channel
MHGTRRIYFVLAVLIVLGIIGTGAYMVLEGWSLIDALYMTIIVITTIGFQEVYPLGTSGKIFTMVFSLISYLFLAGVISVMSSILLEFYFNEHRRFRRMVRKVRRLKNHVIICGEGNVAKYVVEELRKMRETFVLIAGSETRKEVEQAYQEDKAFQRLGHILEGEPTSEEMLSNASIETAKGIVCCLDEDSRNLFAALGARKLNPTIKITSFVDDESNLKKFDLVGVHDVVSGDYILGRRLATSLQDRNISLFLEQAAKTSSSTKSPRGWLNAPPPSDDEVRIGEAKLDPDSPLCGGTLAGADISRNVGLLIIAIRSGGSDRFEFNPQPTRILAGNDVLITMGTDRQIEALQNYVAGSRD